MPAPNNVSKDETTVNQVQEQPARQLSQTDHINKKLLTSLFNRLEQGGNSALAKMLEAEDKTEENDEWKD